MSEFRKVPGYNVNIQKLVYLHILVTNNYIFKLKEHHLQ